MPPDESNLEPAMAGLYDHPTSRFRRCWHGKTLLETIMPRLRMVLLSAALLVAALPLRADEPAPLKGLDEYITQAMKDWDVPGLSVAVVKDDAVVLAKGYGVRKLGESATVDKDSLFAVGSTSKAFTAACLAILVDEGKIKWDDPATKYLPSLQMNDPYVTRELTVRDLLTHRCGLGRIEMIWYGQPVGRDEVLRRVRYLKPSASFRSKFGYSNIMYLAAGQVVPAVTGKSWDDFVKERFFKPLGMTNSNTSVRDLEGRDDVATPHKKIDEKVEPVPYRNIDNIGPAGSINSSAADMAQWVRLLLREGQWEKGRLLSSGALSEMLMPQTVIRLEGTAAKMNPESHFTAYGLGWMLRDYRGKKVAAHSGGIDGMSSHVALLPEEKVGVVVLSNLDSNMLPVAIANRVLDAYLKAPARDWSADLRKVMKGVEEIEKKEEKRKEEERVKDTKPSLALEKYDGSYKDDAYGELKVKLQKGKLVASLGPAFVTDLEHWHYDTFRAVFRDRTMDKGMMTFALGGDGKVAEAKVDGFEGEEVTFKRAADAPDETPAITLKEDELKQFVGKYELKTPPLEISIELVGGKLKAVVPGQPSYTLVPIKPTRFKIEGAPAGYYAQFDVADGKVKGVTLEQGKGPKLTFEPKQ